MRAQPDGGGPAARAVEGALGRRQGEEAPLLLRHGLPGEYMSQRFHAINMASFVLWADTVAGYCPGRFYFVQY